MTDLLVRRSGTLIDISPDGQTPIDPRIVEMLKPLLTYQHKTLLRGHQRYGPDGNSRAMDIEVRNMFKMEEGRLVTGFGFLTSIAQLLGRHGIRLHYVDLSPPKDPSVYVPDWDNVRRYVQFRPKQEECLYYISQNECGLINATMGFGKTYMFEAIAHLYPRAKIDIIVRPKDVASRIVRQLSRSIPNVGMIGGGEKLRGDRITVYTAGSCHHADGNADFLLGDEIHQLMTDETSKAMAQAWRFTRNFGFTATPSGRMDGADAQLEMFFGRQIFHLSYQAAVSLGLVVPIHVRWIPIRLDHNPAHNKDGVTKMRWGIWRNQDRNRLIAEDVRRQYPDPNTQILILTATVDHAIMLWQFLPEFALCYGQSIDAEDIERYKRNHYIPQNFIEVTASRRDEMRRQFEAGTLKRVIATDVWSTGVDFAQLQVLYRADARDSEILDSQGPGRVSRISPDSGKEIGEVIDCYDVFDTSFKRKSESRKRHYAALGWSQDWPSGRRQLSAS
jgi:superfamily II DNA or RNA helicase